VVGQLDLEKPEPPLLPLTPLRYRNLLSARVGAEVRAVLAVEREPSDPSWAELLEAEGVLLVWPGQMRIAASAP
jgi:hypothetical protein